MMSIDRRIIYLMLMITAVAPFFFSMDYDANVTPKVESIYDYIENVPEGSYVLLAIDYDPQTEAECSPQAKCILRHYFSRNLKVIFTALSQNGSGMAELLIKEIAKEYDKENGVDYAFLGYKPYPGIVIMSMGQNFRISFPEDYYNTPLDDLEVMQGIKNYEDVKLVVSIGAGNIGDMWINYAHERYKVPLALAVTAVMGPQLYPFLQSKQLIGFISGLKGAAEYEKLMEAEMARLCVDKQASKGMPVQAMTHLLIIIFIILGNIGYFLTRDKSEELGSTGGGK